MTSATIRLIKSEWLLRYRQPQKVLYPVFFFIMTSILFPLTLSPSVFLLQEMGIGVIWVAVLLSQLLSLPQLFQEEYEAGSLLHLLLSNTCVPWLLWIKVMMHWLTLIVPLLLAMPLVGLLYHLPLPVIGMELLTVLLASPTLALLAALLSALTVSLPNSTLLLTLLLLPLYIPLLIFATLAVFAVLHHQPYSAELALLGAFLLFSCLLLPFALKGILSIGLAR